MQHQAAFPASAGGKQRSCPRVIRLQSAAGNQGVATVCLSLPNDSQDLSHLVSAAEKRQQIIPLDPEIDTQVGTDPGQAMNR
jgi:hypothetical protein